MSVARVHWVEWLAKFNPDQPRVPAGSPDGGQWTSGGGAAGPVEGEQTVEGEWLAKPDSGLLTSARAAMDAWVRENVSEGQWSRQKLAGLAKHLAAVPEVQALVKDYGDRTKFPDRPAIEIHPGDASTPSIFLLGWRQGESTPIHDHAASEVAVHVMRGSVEEDVFSLPDEPGDELHEDGRATAGIKVRRQLFEGSTVTLPAPYMHVFTNEDAESATSLHLYYPKLSRMRFYRFSQGTRPGKGQIIRESEWREEQVASSANPEAGRKGCCTVLVKFNPDQPRVPAGQEGGGQWTSGVEYHGTAAEKLDAILAQGLRAEYSGTKWPDLSKVGLLYVTSDLSDAEKWARERATWTTDAAGGIGTTNVAILAIQIPPEQRHRLEQDENSTVSWHRQFRGDIPPEWIVGVWRREVEWFPSDAALPPDPKWERVKAGWHRLYLVLVLADGETKSVQKFNPDQPRVPAGEPGGGQWTSEGGVTGAGTQERPYKVGGDLQSAAQLLARGYWVELDQPRSVSTLLEELHEIATEAIAKGEQAPHYDLCKVSVPGTNLFCQESLGVSRVQMPQLAGKPIPGSLADGFPRTAFGDVNLSEAFGQFLQSSGYAVTRESIDSRFLRASQNELNGAKVAAIHQAMLRGQLPGEQRLWVSRDDYVIDGHHRWAADVAHEHRTEGAAHNIPIHRVDLDIGTILNLANLWTEMMGLPGAKVKGFNPDQPRVPAGSPDGGQWLGLGTATDEAGTLEEEIALISPKTRGEKLADAHQTVDMGLALNPGLTAIQKREFSRAAYNVLNQMPEAALDRIRANVETIRFLGSSDAMRQAYLAIPGMSLRDDQAVGGWYNYTERSLTLDGSSPFYGAASDIYAHEFAHALDFGPDEKRVSFGYDWFVAWQEEIATPHGAPLSKYAQTAQHEGWAEFGRLIYTQGGARDARERFPKSWAVWVKHGLVPEEHVKAADEPAQALVEVFAESIESDGLIADTLLTTPPVERWVESLWTKTSLHPDTHKRTQASVDYREGTATKRCGNCVMFRPPDSCTDVRGPIAPEMVCDIWAPKREAKFDPDQPRVPAGQEGGGQWTSAGAGAAVVTPLDQAMEAERHVRESVARMSKKFNIPEYAYVVMPLGLVPPTWTIAGQTFQEFGHFDPREGLITIWASQAAKIVGVGWSDQDSDLIMDRAVAHESMHLVFNRVFSQYQHERVKVLERDRATPDGIMRMDGTLKPEYAAEYPTYQAFEQLWVESGGAAGFEKADGFTAYSTMWWDAWKSGQRMGEGVFTPINETLAEMAGNEFWSTADRPVHESFKKLYSLMLREYDRLERG